MHALGFIAVMLTFVFLVLIITTLEIIIHILPLLLIAGIVAAVLLTLGRTFGKEYNHARKAMHK